MPASGYRGGGTAWPSDRACCGIRAGFSRGQQGLNALAALKEAVSMGSRLGSRGKRAAIRPPSISSFGIKSTRIIHVELDRVRGHLEAHNLAHFQFDVADDDVVVEDAARLEKRAILVEIAEGVAQRAADGGDFLYFLWWQIVDNPCPSPDPDRSCSGSRRGPPSASRRIRGKGWPPDLGSALRRASPWGRASTWEYDRLPSDCAPSRRGGQAPRILAPTACRNSSSGW